VWIAMTDSFVSAVQDRNDPSRLVVRARKAEHLERLFPPTARSRSRPRPITWPGSWFPVTSS
jgi:hypothetical protein